MPWIMVSLGIEGVYDRYETCCTRPHGRASRLWNKLRYGDVAVTLIDLIEIILSTEVIKRVEKVYLGAYMCD